MLKEPKSKPIVKRGVNPNAVKKKPVNPGSGEKEKSKKEKSKKVKSDSKKKKKKKQGQTGEMPTAKAIGSKEKCQPVKKEATGLEKKTSQEDLQKAGNGSVKSPPMEQPEQQTMGTWVKEILGKTVADLASDYKSNQETYDEKLIEAWNANKEENRYSNMPCLEKSRVKIAGVKNDYINANYVGPPENPKRFICTQGPLDETIEKFWRMVVANGCEVIIMLCDFMENGDDKCAIYYPDQVPGSMAFGPVTIKCYGRSVEENCGKILTTLLEVKLGEEKPLTVRHTKFVGWPDHGIPANSDPLLKMVHRARASRRGSVVIHCSAGIGRTGTCLLVAMALDEMKKGQFNGLWPLLEKIREQRAFAVQTKKQYIFAYRCLIDRAVEKGIIPAGPELDKFQRDYETFIAGSSKKKKAKKTPSKEAIAPLPTPSPLEEQKTQQGNG